MKWNTKLLILFISGALFLAACKPDEQSKIDDNKSAVKADQQLFYGYMVYSSQITSTDSVIKKTLNTFSPHKVKIYVDANNFRMVEEGGLSHANIIIYTDTKEAWQLDTAKNIAHLGEYSDLGDPSNALKNTMPDHYAPAVTLTGDTASILGYMCDKYLIERSGFIPSSDRAYIWVARNLKFPSTRYDVQTEINRSTVPTPLYIGYEEGAVLRMVVINKTYTRTFEVTTLKQNYFPPHIFEIPSNFQKK